MLGSLQAQTPANTTSAKLPTLEEAVASRSDLWGEAALRQPDGPSYEFFEKLLPPPRYVNADFKYYPIVLSAPNNKVKARLISNGSGINLRAGSRSWHDTGTPVTFRVGPDEFLFGGLRDRLSEPTLAEGFLPIVEIRYRHASPWQSEGLVPVDQKKVYPVPEIYRLESFAGTDPALADNGVVFTKFSLAQGSNGIVTVQVGAPGPLKFADGNVTDEQGQVLACFDTRWKWERQRAQARLTPNTSATLAVPTKPIPVSARFEFTAATYGQEREACARAWRQILAQGMNVETPEPRVNNAWRQLLIQNFELINGDRVHYSAGNQYDQLYEAEGSDAALAMLMWGYERDMRRLMVPLFDFTRKGLEFHQAGFKLLNLSRYYWQTRDAAAVKELQPRWEKEARRLDENRTGPNGLFPKERYCGDIATPVYTINANAKGWRALRDLSAVLAEVGEQDEAQHYAQVASEFRKTVLTAIGESVRRETTPPFVPVALYGNEPPHDPICNVRIGSYWNIIIGYTIASGIFPAGSEEETWIPRYQEQHGGLCMGMLRAGGGAFNFWTGEHRINPLYGTRYVLDTLRRDDPEGALVSFYGMLAQGFTRNTFVCAEGCSLAPVDDGGRFFYCPPNSAANGHFLSMLRSLLVQDWDLDDDGRPETLRLLFATPRRWLNDGQTIQVEHAPTAFGEVSARVQSRLSQGEVSAEVELPRRQTPRQTLLRLRVPEGWQVKSAQVGSQTLEIDARGTTDISGLKGKFTVRFQVEKHQ
ncbi:MAG: hypothetical protein E6K60_12165 [Nitrospirae bacterium]|nr:MAG: hypothetical protein E6K60_12165 [Nitrospirota bacterium]